jgi:hypothetical protein
MSQFCILDVDLALGYSSAVSSWLWDIQVRHSEELQGWKEGSGNSYCRQMATRPWKDDLIQECVA